MKVTSIIDNEQGYGYAFNGKLVNKRTIRPITMEERFTMVELCELIEDGKKREAAHMMFVLRQRYVTEGPKSVCALSHFETIEGELS